jgi:cytochrome c peroxidase
VLLTALLASGAFLVSAVSGNPLVDAASADGGAIAPLSSVAAPSPTNLSQYVADRAAAIRLGKALFWDMQAGSDGQTACATCHYNAGADTRSRNTVNPKGSWGSGSPNQTLTAGMFPFHQLSDPGNRNSAVISDTPAVVGSQGVQPSHFDHVATGSQVDAGTADGPDPTFSIHGINVRRVTGRNAPPVVNAVFNFRNFWDGRAQNDFNGVNPFGSRDPSARVAVADANGNLDLVRITNIQNASLASQAVGPPGNPVEMSSDGRSLKDIGKKLLGLAPLGRQRVSPSDSVLGPLATPGGTGLTTDYATLVQQAFLPKWWSSSQILRIGNDGGVTVVPGHSPLLHNEYTLVQFNWSLFWGLSIDLYESTLVSDQTPVDRYLAGDPTALNASEVRGLGVFQSGKANCTECHSGAELTTASVSSVQAEGISDVRSATDTGFVNIGVRPTSEDLGNGGSDPFGNSLSITKQSGAAGASDGSFKVPSLRNVALTAPYFHNGGQLTLAQVVDFYNRGGDFANPQLHRDIEPLGLVPAEKADLVAFLGALTDPRVENQSAPFDHPELFVPDGHLWEVPETELRDDGSGTGRAADNFVVIPATGAAGGAPLNRFADPGTPGTPPPLVFDFTGPGVSIDAAPADPTTNASPEFAFSSADPGAAFECSLSTAGDDFRPCTSPASYAALSEGRYTFKVRATNASGNSDVATRTFSLLVDHVAPTVQQPSVALPAGKQLGASSVSSVVAWSGTDASSGIARFELQQSLNGRAFTDLSLSSPTATKRQVALAIGSAYQFRVRATDVAGNVSPWVTGPTFLAVVDQQDAPAVAYAGTWTNESPPGVSGGSVRSASAAGAKATFTFTGQAVAWIAQTGPNLGKAAVFLDGTRIHTVDLYSARARSRRLVFAAPLRSDATHTLQIRVLGTKNPASTGTKVDVDAFVRLL